MPATAAIDAQSAALVDDDRREVNQEYTTPYQTEVSDEDAIEIIREDFPRTNNITVQANEADAVPINDTDTIIDAINNQAKRCRCNPEAKTKIGDNEENDQVMGNTANTKVKKISNQTS